MVKTLDTYRAQDWTADDIVDCMTPPKTALGCATFMMDVSLMLRGLVYDIHIHLKNNLLGSRSRAAEHPRNPCSPCTKILVTEKLPLLAWWWDLTLNLLGYETVTSNSALTPAERDQLVARFNDSKNQMKAMVLSYDVGALGVNLQADCPKVVFMTSAKNQGIETRLICRPVRVRYQIKSGYTLRLKRRRKLTSNNG
jgi:hypothetical protein